MKTNYEFITRGEEVFLLTKDTKTVSLTEAVGNVAMSVYASLSELSQETDLHEKKRLEKKILLQSKALNAMSNALEATRHVR